MTNVGSVSCAKWIAALGCISALLVSSLFLVSCEQNELEAVADRASATGSLEGSSLVIEQYYYLQKYQASSTQTQVALRNGLRVVQQSKKKLPKYIAVSTLADKRSKGKASVMIYNTESRQVVGENVYDLAQRPKDNDQIKSDELTAPFEHVQGEKAGPTGY